MYCKLAMHVHVLYCGIVFCDACLLSVDNFIDVKKLGLKKATLLMTYIFWGWDVVLTCKVNFEDGRVG